MKTTGEKIRELRLENHLTLDDVAKALGVGRQAIYKYEQGTVTNIPLDNLQKMAVLFGTSPGYLAGWSDDPPPKPEPEHTLEGRLLVQGVDIMPKDIRERVVSMIVSGYPEYFKKENNNDNT